jgi:predicted nucleic acid-binding protein
MILVDTSVWVDHLRARNAALADLLNRGSVLAHPFVIGELALGQMRQREIVLGSLAALPGALVATDVEVLKFVERHALFGRGVGYIDAHLLAAVQLTQAVGLWTMDKRLRAVAEDLGLARGPPFP